MRQERNLLVPYVTLDQRALKDLAEHIECLAAEGRAKAEADLEALESHPKEAAGRAKDRRTETVASRRLNDNPVFGIGLNDGGMSDERWSDLWDRSSPADVRSVGMRALGNGVSVEVNLNLASGYGSHVQISSDEVDAFNREIGWFSDFFKRYRAVGRGRIHLRTWTGIGMVVVVGVGSAALTYLIAKRFASEQTSFVASLVAEACSLLVAFAGGRFIAPRVLIRDAGPHLGLRRYAPQIAFGVLTSVVGALVVMLALWVLVPSGQGG